MSMGKVNERLQEECPDWVVMYVQGEGEFGGRLSAMKTDRRPYNRINEIECDKPDEETVLAALPRLVRAIKEKNIIPRPVNLQFATMEDEPLGGIRMIIKDRWAVWFPGQCAEQVEFLTQKLNQLADDQKPSA